MKHLKLFEQFTNEGKRGPSYSEEEIAKMKQSLAEGIAREKIDRIDIENITYQYRINGTEVNGKAYAGETVIGEGYYQFPFDELSEILRDEIEDGYKYQDCVYASSIFGALPEGIRVTVNGEDLDPDEGVDVEEGSDS